MPQNLLIYHHHTIVWNIVCGRNIGEGSVRIYFSGGYPQGDQHCPFQRSTINWLNSLQLFLGYSSVYLLSIPLSVPPPPPTTPLTSPTIQLLHSFRLFKSFGPHSEERRRNWEQHRDTIKWEHNCYSRGDGNMAPVHGKERMLAAESPPQPS